MPILCREEKDYQRASIEDADGWCHRAVYFQLPVGRQNKTFVVFMSSKVDWEQEQSSVELKELASYTDSSKASQQTGAEHTEDDNDVLQFMEDAYNIEDIPIVIVELNDFSYNDSLTAENLQILSDCEEIENISLNVELNHSNENKWSADYDDISSEYKSSGNNSATQLCEDLKNVPEHVFGSHSKSKDEYCRRGEMEEENLIPLLESSSILDEIKKIVDNVVRKASRLTQKVTRNHAERYMSFVAKFSGEKRANYILRGSYQRRYYGAALSFNSGPTWQATSLNSYKNKNYLKRYCKKKNYALQYG
ncbi:hypothetical protein ILUMI_00154 [Ignelater luminosus]|uniref:Uncharacterized protein n=1 Tax=Ignelater luminosus TaxID=2038154 RepID=A0A8K0DH00_IGNLU|nr:hypothetical protein ILUMI_00154 [Ignelater luminosus]